ncbi:hypothetical protein ID866_4635 [Astraeus odoratus]|nr:hypothetical protein ID866_4635 [Astraeus odoratus]
MSSSDISKSRPKNVPSFSSVQDASFLQVATFPVPSTSRINLPDTSALLRRSTHYFDRDISSTRPRTACSGDTTRPSPFDMDGACSRTRELELLSSSSVTLLPSPPASPNGTISQSRDDGESLLSERVRGLHAQSRESSHSFIYPLNEPGERIAIRIQRLRSRTAAILQSLPVTVVDVDTLDTPNSPRSVLPTSEHTDQHCDRHSWRLSSKKLRRVSACTNLRDSFRGSTSIMNRGVSEEIQSECNLLESSSHPRTLAHSSVDTLVEPLAQCLPAKVENVKDKNARSPSSYPPGTLSSPSPSSHRSFASQDPRVTSTYTSLQHPFTPYPTGSRQSASLRGSCDEFGLVYIGGPLWSCAKISRSAAKRAARRASSSKSTGFMSYASVFPLSGSLSK